MDSSTAVDSNPLPPAPREPSWLVYLPIVLVALLGVGATWGLFHEVARLERHRVQGAFAEAARDRILVIRREVRNSLSVVQDIGSFFDSSGRVRRRQFREFVQPVLKRDPSIRALEWVPVVAGGERSGFVAAAGVSFPRFRLVDLDPAGELVAAPERAEYFPLLYVQPYRAGETPLGLDLGALPEERAALERTRELGRTWVEERRVRLPGGGVESRLIVYLPIYRRAGEEDAAGEERQAAEIPVPGAEPARLRGFAIGRFAIAGIVEQALSSLSPGGIDMVFLLADADPDAAPLHVHRSRIRDQDAAVEEGAAGLDWRLEDNIELENRRWRVVCTPVPGRFRPGTWSARVVMVSGIAFTTLFVVYLSTLIGRAQQVKRLVSQRTQELRLANEELNRQVADRIRAESALQRLNATLEQRVARRTAEAERRAAELEQFAYVASHDLKAPLRAIANLAQWLGDDLASKLTVETKEQLALLRDRVARMHDLIEGLLTYSRVGRTAEAVEEVDSAALVAETLDSLGPPPGFEIEVAPGMPVLVTDRLQLGQVFANLLSNSIKHHHREPGHIRVAGRELGDGYEFSVADDGPGIPPEYHHKVFMMFQTLKVKDFGGDTGIGLALVKKIVEEHGGSIRLESAVGEGATFRFTWTKAKGGDESPNGRDDASGKR